MQVKHPFVSSIPDDPVAAAAGEVVPSNWNANHTVTGTASSLAGYDSGGNSQDVTIGSGLTLSGGTLEAGVNLNNIVGTGTLYVNGGVVEEAVFANGNSGTSFALNLDNGNFQSLKITGAVTITQTVATHPGKYLLVVTQDGTGHVYGFSGIKWSNGSAPTLSTTAGAIDLVSFAYDGTNIYGIANIAFA